MNILLLGGTGFIGSYIAEELLKEKHEVTVLSRGKSKNILRDNSAVRQISGDRNDRNLMNDLAGLHFDAVIDMTAFTKKDSQRAVEAFNGKTDRFIHTSTVSVYMVSNIIQCPITEDQDKGELMEFWQMNPFGMQYGIDKRSCEDVLWEAFRKYEFPVTMVRPPYVCGPHDPARRDFFWIERILDGGPLLVPGSGDYASQNVFVRDLARSYVELLQHDFTTGHAYNVASEEINSLNDYLDKLCMLLGKEPERIHVDIETFLKKPFSVSNEGHAFPFNTFRTTVFSLDKIKKDINFVSTPFEDWMPETIEWYLNECSGHSVGYSSRKDEISFLRKYHEIKSRLLSSL
ncbi:MAG: NAD-dependent epimerase/dehydratase family protein [Melioribacteraceae bacterium]|nr:NAD-dependent epimerase/dehydratase family protein [Melioribacteraceae bacterium]